MNNLATIAQLMRGRNPQEVALQMVKNNQINDPNISNLIKYAQSGNTAEFTNLAQQLFQQRGLDLNSTFQSFINLLK